MSCRAMRRCRLRPGSVTALVLTAAVGWVASKFVNINRFSLHGLYRNRLVRAFLGGSNQDREKTRNPFTGFDENDNVPMWQLWPTDTGRGEGWRPFHIVNIALNIVSTKKLAWQERKAEPFTVSPLHSGTACKAYPPSKQYGHQDRGISLGTALAISGAAASPNMGYHSLAVDHFPDDAVQRAAGLVARQSGQGGQDDLPARRSVVRDPAAACPRCSA